LKKLNRDSGDISGKKTYFLQIVSRQENTMTHNISAGSIAGPNRITRNEENQDYFYHITENGVTVIAVADGAGSLSMSHIGAQLAATTAAGETIDSVFDGNSLEDSVRTGIARARDVLLERDDHNLTGCTLAVAVIADHGWAAGVVGDAFAVVSFADDSHELVQPDCDSEHIHAATLLTSKTCEPVYRSGTDSVLAVSAASDGLIPLSLEDGKPLQGFWTPIVNRTSDEDLNVTAFLEHINSNDKINDDTTLVIASI
jgi:hypothetical protein